MFFSVIIPVYNVEKYLCECVESVLEQDEKAGKVPGWCGHRHIRRQPVKHQAV